MFKEKLLDAVKTAVVHYNDSNDPDQAIIKTASTYDFNADQTKRLIETFNTAHAVDRYQNKEDGLGTFKLANADKIIVELFNPAILGDKTTKIASDILTDYSEYDTYEQDYNKPAEPIVTHKKAYMEDLDLGMLLNTGNKEVRKLQTQAKAAKQAYASGSVAYDEEVRSLVSDLNLKWPEKRAEILGALVQEFVGKEAEMAVVTNIGELADSTPGLQVKFGGLFDNEPYADYIRRVEEIADIASVSEDLLKSSETLEKVAEDLRGELDSVLTPLYPKGFFFFLNKEAFGGVSRGFYSGSDQPDKGKEDKGKEDKGKEDNRGFIKLITPKAKTKEEAKHELIRKGVKGVAIGTGAILKSPGSIAGSVGRSPFDAAKAYQGSALQSTLNEMGQTYLDRNEANVKDLENFDKDLERSDVLQELLIKDPYLSSEDPKHVAELYNRIESLAPNLARNKAIMTSILRQAAQTPAIDAYDANTWLQMEDRLRKLEDGRPFKDDK